MDFFEKLKGLEYEEIVTYLAYGMIGNGLFVAPILSFVLPAYYGRYATSSVFPVNAKLSWIVQGNIFHKSTGQASSFI